MSIDRSLKIEGALKRHRNVLTRAERIGQLKDEERWAEEQSVFGLPKVAHRKSHAGRKAAKEEAAAVEGTVAGATPEAPATAGAKPTTAAAGAAPAKAAGAKPAAAAPAKEKPKSKGKG